MNKRRLGLLLIVLTLFSLMFLMYGAGAEESTCPASVTASAVLARGETELTVYSDTDKTEKLGKLKKGDTCQILGVSGAYYRIRFNETDGYAAKSKLALKGAESEAAFTGNVTADLALDEYLYASLTKSKTMAIHGSIQSDVPLDTLFVYLWDERLQRVEHVLVKEVKNPAANLDIEDVFDHLEFSSMTAGRKTLLIQGAADGRLADIYRTPLYICGSFKPVRNINDQCKFSAGKKQNELGGRTWTPSAANKPLTITLPADGAAVLMTIEWRFPAEAFTVAFLDEGKNIISEETKTTGFYADSVKLPPEARQVQLFVTGAGNMVRNLCIYDANYPADAVQQWQAVPEKLDLLLFSPHQDDELLFMGGTIPYACHLGADVGVVYMANCGRGRYAEAMDGLWTTGLRNHPIFMNWADQWCTGASYALQTWSQNGVDPQKEVVRLIRKHKPEVIMAPDPLGEYGHAQHKVTSKLVSDGIFLAMDETYDPETVKEYGVWEVKKVYLHLYSENQIELDWDKPFTANSPVSPIFLAKEAYDKHRSQQKAYSMTYDGEKYTNDRFGLFYTAVGPDENKNDIFENIDLQ